MFTRTIVFIAMLVILLSLASGLIFLVRDAGKTKRTVTALTWRIGISVALFLFLLLAFSLDWITPHSVWQQAGNFVMIAFLFLLYFMIGVQLIAMPNRFIKLQFVFCLFLTLACFNFHSHLLGLGRVKWIKTNYIR